jgi:hypothetical protein
MKRLMKKIFCLLAAIALVIAGCVQQQTGVDFRDCANSISCLKEQTQASCGPAKATVTLAGVTVYAEITAKQGSETTCNLFIQLRDMTLPERASEETRRELEEARPLFSLATMDCEIARLEANRLDDPLFLTAEQYLDKCDGILKDEIGRRLQLFRSADASPAPAASAQATVFAATATPEAPTTIPTPSPESTATPSATPVASPTVSATPTASPAATPTPTPASSPLPTPPPGVFQLSEALPGGGALEYYAPTQMLLVGKSFSGIDVYRLNSTRLDFGSYLFPPVVRSAANNFTFNKLKLSPDGEYVYGATRTGFVVLKFFPNGTLSGPLSTIPASDGYGSFDIALSGNFAYVSFLRSLKKIDISNPNAVSVVGDLSYSSNLYGFAVKDEHLIVSWVRGTYDDPSVAVFSPSLEQIATYPNTRFNRAIFKDMVVDGNTIYAAGGSIVLVLDAANLSNLNLQRTVQLQTTYRPSFDSLVVTPTKVYASGSWYNQGQGRSFAMLGIFEKAANPTSMPAYWGGRADGTYADLVVDEANPYFYGGVAAVHGTFRGAVLHLGLLPLRDQIN